MREDKLSSYGYDVHYVTWGNKDPRVLLIHNMGMDGHSMDQLAESLQDTHQVLSLTILNHGARAMEKNLNYCPLLLKIFNEIDEIPLSKRK